MGDKMRRLRQAHTGDGQLVVSDESLFDTAMDLSNYALMTAMFIDKKNYMSDRISLFADNLNIAELETPPKKNINALHDNRTPLQIANDIHKSLHVYRVGQPKTVGKLWEAPTKHSLADIVMDKDWFDRMYERDDAMEKMMKKARESYLESTKDPLEKLVTKYQQANQRDTNLWLDAMYRDYKVRTCSDMENPFEPVDPNIDDDIRGLVHAHILLMLAQVYKFTTSTVKDLLLADENMLKHIARIDHLYKNRNLGGLAGYIYNETEGFAIAWFNYRQRNLESGERLVIESLNGYMRGGDQCDGIGLVLDSIPKDSESNMWDLNHRMRYLEIADVANKYGMAANDKILLDRIVPKDNGDNRNVRWLTSYCYKGSDGLIAFYHCLSMEPGRNHSKAAAITTHMEKFYGQKMHLIGEDTSDVRVHGTKRPWKREENRWVRQ
jgi:hypothetical protein